MNYHWPSKYVMINNIYIFRFNVDCTETEDFYSINEKIGSTEPISNEDSISSEPAPDRQRPQSSQTNQKRRRPQNQQQPQAQRREGQKPQGQRSQGELLFFVVTENVQW